jgi:hypothetical protein
LTADDRQAPATWVHVFEEDTAEGAVYRPEDADIPLSRRPRERLVLGADGRATLFNSGPDDRLIPRPASWREGVEGKAAEGGADVQIIERSPDRLVVRIA